MAAWPEQGNGSEAEAFAAPEMGSDLGHVSCTPSTPEQWHDCTHDLPQAQVQVLICQMSAMQAALCEQRATLMATQEQLQSSHDHQVAMAIVHEREIQEQRRQISSLLCKMQPMQELAAKKKVKPGKRERKQAKLEKQAESSSESIIHEEHEEESAAETLQPMLEKQEPVQKAAAEREKTSANPSTERIVSGEVSVDAEIAGSVSDVENKVSLSSSLKAVKTAVGHELGPCIHRARARVALCASFFLATVHAATVCYESVHSRYGTQCMQKCKTVADGFSAGARKMAFGCAWFLEVSCTKVALRMLECARACGRVRSGSVRVEESTAPESNLSAESRDPFLEP